MAFSILEQLTRRNALRVTPIDSQDRPLTDPEIFTSASMYRNYLRFILQFQKEHDKSHAASYPILRCKNVLTEVGHVHSALGILSDFISDGLIEKNPYGYHIAMRHFLHTYEGYEEMERELQARLAGKSS